jgi:tripartite ATP-independent transporter DctM subunit
MGQFAFQSGISRDLFLAANRWVGWLPGGLALATNLACTAFAACTGSAAASGATMASISYPEMKHFNYDDRLATGTICAGGTLGILIPPSTIFVIYGFLAQQPIGVLFIAGILPGLLLSGLFMALILGMCARNPRLGPRGEAFSWGERFKSLRGVWGMILLFALVIGGLYFGVFAPSEAGAAGAMGAFLICLVKRAKRSELIVALKKSLETSCMVMTILIGAMIFGAFVSVSGFPSVFAGWVTGLPFSRYAILIFIVLLYIVLGIALDELCMILLTIPTVFPIIKELGFDPIWFGVVIVFVFEIAMVTPPVGMVMYVVQGATKVSIQDIFRGCFPFFIAMVVGLAILIAFPEIALFLPRMMR